MTQFLGGFFIAHTHRHGLIIEVQGNEVEPGDVAVNEIIIQGHKRIQQIAIQTWEVNQGPYGIRQMGGIIQTLHVRQVPLGVEVDIAERGVMLPGHRLVYSGASYLRVVDTAIGRQQPHCAVASPRRPGAVSPPG